MDLHNVYYQLTNRGGFDYEDYPEGIDDVINLMVIILNQGLPADSLIEAYAAPDYNFLTWWRIKWRTKEDHADAIEPEAQIDSILTKAIKDGWSVEQTISITIPPLPEDLTNNVL